MLTKHIDLTNEMYRVKTGLPGFEKLARKFFSLPEEERLTALRLLVLEGKIRESLLKPRREGPE
jgi:hypothetical protein